MIPLKRSALPLIVLFAMASCTDKADKQDSAHLTRREKDSIIGESILPGAGGVRGALRAADSAAARNRRAAEIR